MRTIEVAIEKTQRASIGTPEAPSKREVPVHCPLRTVQRALARPEDCIAGDRSPPKMSPRKMHRKPGTPHHTYK